MSSGLFKRLEKNMVRHLEVFRKISKLNYDFRDSIIIRDINGVTASVANLNELALIMGNLEESRMDLLVSIAKKVSSGENEDFYTLIKRAPEDIRDGLVEKYFEIRTQTIATKSIYKELSSYIERQKETSREIIDILVNDSKGNIYTKPGRKDLRGQGFVLDKQL